MNTLNLITNDNIKIEANYIKNNHEEVVIIAPGWCMTKDSNAFLQIAEMFARKYDVISLDFRGHGKSKGWFTFMAKETMDLDSAVKFAQNKNYKKIYLAGFSLGAGIALIYTAKNRNIDKIIAISAPTDFDKIENKMWKKEAWGETFKKFELNRFLSIRPSIVPHKKIKPINIIDKISVPTLFISGEKDPTVCPWHTETLYNKANCPKEYICIKNGCHAEDLFLHFKDEFSEYCMNWLANEN
jgi:alpha-beta hydrolase superfamily lysophospholipase